MKSKIKLALKIALSILVSILLIIIIYVGYVFITYYRIDDNQVLQINDNTSKVLPVNTQISATTYNVGFGAYSPDFSFFMDGGTESVAKSSDEVVKNINGAIDLIKQIDSDILLIQEIDIDSTRSHHIDQYAMFKQGFNNFDNTIGINYDSSFLMYPIFDPHGKSLAGIGTFSKYNMTDALRRSLPITSSFSKFLDLDRCYTVTQMPTDNGKILYVYNAHLSAYGGTPEIRSAQIKMLFDDMQSRIDEGNYVIAGGDFNHDLTGDSMLVLNNIETNEFGWAQPFPHDDLPKDIRFVDEYSGQLTPTCRDCDTGYVHNETTILIVDGFFVSNNIEVSKIENSDNRFEFSDHNPVTINFSLID